MPTVNSLSACSSVVRARWNSVLLSYNWQIIPEIKISLGKSDWEGRNISVADLHLKSFSFALDCFAFFHKDYYTRQIWHFKLHRFLHSIFQLQHGGEGHIFTYLIIAKLTFGLILPVKVTLGLRPSMTKVQSSRTLFYNHLCHVAF